MSEPKARSSLDSAQARWDLTDRLWANFPFAAVRSERHESYEGESQAFCMALLTRKPLALSLDLDSLSGNIARDFIFEVAGWVVEIHLERTGLRIAMVTQINRLTQVDGP